MIQSHTICTFYTYVIFILLNFFSIISFSSRFDIPSTEPETLGFYRSIPAGHPRPLQPVQQQHEQEQTTSQHQPPQHQPYQSQQQPYQYQQQQQTVSSSSVEGKWRQLLPIESRDQQDYAENMRIENERKQKKYERKQLKRTQIQTIEEEKKRQLDALQMEEAATRMK